LLGGTAGLLESLAAGLAELEVEVAGAPVAGFLLWRFVGFLESVAAGAEVELLAVAGAEVAGAGVFCAAIRLTAASRVKIMGFILVSPSRIGGESHHLTRTILRWNPRHGHRLRGGPRSPLLG
jgi:hypothetical protein